MNNTIQAKCPTPVSSPKDREVRLKEAGAVLDTWIRSAPSGEVPQGVLVEPQPSFCVDGGCQCCGQGVTLNNWTISSEDGKHEVFVDEMVVHEMKEHGQLAEDSKVTKELDWILAHQ